ncbi:head maturation protease, ClpP-related [Oceanobacter sp. 3_MG-2023]|uniref:head maturation protease, ClpP-related n=1 Tax=Oceanobacter sp. 3_MG-2023 TaxID=3062622 RepID=UPI00273659DD|nr:head maturation protease, ClpP-related [Oceanobacter sp. 3_MG-2023]MDP2505391.1 Clp protease ClpP [Oceanobacter sp. 3_MG-2023]
MNMNRLLNLLQNNAERGQKVTINAEAGADTTHVYLYDAIGGWWGVEAETFVKELMAIDTANIMLHINSPGGDVFDGRAIATAIKQHPANITAQIDGLCASAATYVSAACNSVTMADGGFYMIHEGWTLAIGNKRDMDKTRALLAKVDDAILNDYQKKTGLERDQLNIWMEEETWFSASEAKNHGFIDSILDDEKTDSTNNRTRWNLSAYANTPAALAASNEPEPEIEESEHRARLKRQVEALALAI